MRHKFRFLLLLALIVSMFSAVVVAQASDHTGDDNDHIDIANDSFYKVWKRTDLPVAQGKVHRTWIWGPGANTHLIEEDYLEGDDGTRYVQYFDKSRMEISVDDVDSKSPWYVTQGRLAYELMSGNIQLGHHEYYENGASQRSAAGDLHDTTAPTYAVMGEMMDQPARATGHVITEHIDRYGNVTSNDYYAHYGVTDYKYDAVTNHNIASVFWKFMNSTGLVYDYGYHKSYSKHLFEDPLYAVGRPLTEAFWADVTVAGKDQSVLIQCFERRCLTFTPENPKGWQVESGNIGQHYYDWRYIEKGGVIGDDDDDHDDNGDNGTGDNGTGDNGNGDNGTGDNGDNGTGDNGNGDNGDNGNGDNDDNGNGDNDDNGTGDNGTGDNGDNGIGDNGNGVDAPDSLGIRLTAQVNTLGTEATVNVTLNNSSDWEGSVDLEMRCDGDLVDTGVVNIAANASASAQLSHSSDTTLSVEACTVTALINGQVVASDTVVIVDLMPGL